MPKAPQQTNNVSKSWKNKKNSSKTKTNKKNTSKIRPAQPPKSRMMLTWMRKRRPGGPMRRRNVRKQLPRSTSERRRVKEERGRKIKVKDVREARLRREIVTGRRGRIPKASYYNGKVVLWGLCEKM